jgi:hypothetical protein
MPGTTDGILNDKTTDERPAVMCTCGSYGEYGCSAAHQQYLLVPAVADELAAIGKISERDALREIRAA